MEVTRTFDLLERYRTLFPEKEDVFAAKRNGKWVKFSTRDYIQQSHWFAYGLLEMGLKPGDKISTINNNRPEWNFVDMGLAMSGIIHVPLFATLDAAGYKKIIEHAEIKMIFVSDKSLYNKIKNVALECSSVNNIYTFEQVEGATNWSEIVELGKKHEADYKEKLERIKSGIKAEDFFTLIYTSGTTGNSKGVMLSHQNLISNSIAAANVFQLKPEHRYLSILPICHVGERMGNYQSQYSGCGIYYAESIASVATDLQDVKPHAFGAVPRILEKVFDKIVDKGESLSGIKKKLFAWSLRLGLRYKLKGENGFWYELQLKIANKIIFSKWREVMGGNVIYIGVGGAALQPRLERVFWAAGIRLANMYGLTETSPIITINRISGPLLKLGTVGAPIEKVEVKIADDGEILCKGPNVMLGYYKDEKASAEVLKGGWFHTGDVGILEEGKFLRITDRKKEVFKLSNGKYVAPAAIENLYKESVYIDQLMVIGEGEKFASAIISPAFDALKKFCSEKGIENQDKKKMIELKEVQDLFHKIANEFNKNLGSDEKIKRFRLIADEWTPDSGDLSPTLKLKRKIIMEKYQSIVQDIFRHEHSL